MKKYLQSRKRILCIVAPAIIGLIYLVLCFANINQSIWFDESYSSYITRFDYGQMLEFTAADVHPPLYYILLKTWAHFFGHTDFAMRAMSAIFGAIAIVFVYLWLKYKYGASAAILGSFMMSIAPIFVRYGQEMRMYTLVMAIVFAATYFLQLAVDNGKKVWWVIYALLLVAGMYTHYFVAFAWVAHLVYLIKIYGKKIFQKQIILTYISAVILYIPWLPSLISQTKTVENGFWISDASAEGLTGYFTETLLYDRPGNISNWLLVLFIITIITIIALAIRYRKKLSMLFILSFVPLVILILLSMPPLKSMFVSRYIMYSMVSIAILEAVHGNYNFVTCNKATAKELYESIVALDGGENLSIISADPWLYYDLAAYTSYHHDVNFIDETTDYLYGSLKPLEQSYFGKIDDLDKFLGDREAVWYVGTEPEEGYLEFPRENWRVVTSASMQFDDRGNRYQILKLERE